LIALIALIAPGGARMESGSRNDAYAPFRFFHACAHGGPWAASARRKARAHNARIAVLAAPGIMLAQRRSRWPVQFASRARE